MSQHLGAVPQPPRTSSMIAEAPDERALERSIHAHRQVYRGYTIRVKQDFGAGFHLIDGMPCRRGYVVCDANGCNAMPAATWFQTVAAAREAIDIWILVDGDADRFWNVIRAPDLKQLASREFGDLRARLQVAIDYGKAHRWSEARRVLKKLTDGGAKQSPDDACAVDEGGSYYVLDQVTETWLQDDERSWGKFAGAVEFTDAHLAFDIGQRESQGKRDIVVLGRVDLRGRPDVPG